MSDYGPHILVKFEDTDMLSTQMKSLFVKIQATPYSHLCTYRVTSHQERKGLKTNTHYLCHRLWSHILVKFEDTDMLPTQMRALFVRIQHTGLNQKLHWNVS